jgi:hypothetical protein
MLTFVSIVGLFRMPVLQKEFAPNVSLLPQIAQLAGNHLTFPLIAAAFEYLTSFAV